VVLGRRGREKLGWLASWDTQSGVWGCRATWRQSFCAGDTRHQIIRELIIRRVKNGFVSKNTDLSIFSLEKMELSTLKLMLIFLVAFE
jgi:hypothetical protein